MTTYQPLKTIDGLIGRQMLPDVQLPVEFMPSHWAENPFVRFQRDWSHWNNAGVTPPAGQPVDPELDVEAAWAQMKAINADNSLPFEERVGYTAYLCSLWFSHMTFSGKTYW